MIESFYGALLAHARLRDLAETVDGYQSGIIKGGAAGCSMKVSDRGDSPWRVPVALIAL
ncbi:hypothetical protein [Paraburkholderia kirstenboschensis]|uniref:Uncharacterized protein n=1 Tax=Paraburkholderia kirstenboschensis TaxID=1245436 RepID=A0ABZ0ER03_9BURK|nr:hypothetical protein [Paraburkholderia kirstenboschensis]WOD18804.1 hypothetical protein RW095_39625 [Paraburkholderia kirstenboschensis]